MPATDVRTAIAEQRKQKSEQSWFGLLKKAASEFMSDDAMTWAAAVACYTLLALAPLIVVAIKVGAILLRNKAQGQIGSQAAAWMGDAAAQAINEIINKASQPGKGTVATIISLLLAVFSATGVFAQLQAAMNRIWKVKQNPGQAIWAFLRSRGLSLLVVLFAAVLLLGSVFIATWLGHFTKYLGMGWKWVTWVIDVGVSVGVLTVLFALLFRTLPDAQIEWRSTWVGAILTAVLFEVGRFGLALYFKYAAPSSAFGAFGSLAAVLIWIFYSCQIMFFGAEFTYVYAQARGHGIRPSKHARSLTKCDETESATPGDKPPPPGAPPANKQKRRELSPYGAVLAPHARGGGARSPVRPEVLHQLARHEATVRSYLAAGAGLAVGALIGGYGALHAKGGTKPGEKDVAAARLDERIRRVERKAGHISRIKRLVEREDVSDRIDKLEDEIQHAARKARRVQRRHGRNDSWVDRTVEKVKSYF
jgi:membrane protein